MGRTIKLCENAFMHERKLICYNCCLLKSADLSVHLSKRKLHSHTKLLRSSIKRAHIVILVISFKNCTPMVGREILLSDKINMVGCFVKTENAANTPLAQTHGLLEKNLKAFHILRCLQAS